ncbi:hypothetical protein BKI52_44050 [marine bacterium AO1-C]|nr:hypothetical protein BKI52_44050 [marine bacterium AO1-C]
MKTSNQSGPTLKPSLPSPEGSLSGYGGQFKVAGFTGSGGISLGGLEYHTSAGNGEHGFGFGVASGKGISRSTHRNTPTYDDDLDTFELAGQMLVPLLEQGKRVIKYGSLQDEAVDQQYWKRPIVHETKGNNDYEVRPYLPQKENDHALIYYWKRLSGKSTTLPSSFWVVISADNSLSLFGVNDVAKVSDRDSNGTLNPERVCSWLAEEHLDALGHCTLTKYAQENKVGVNDHVAPEKNHAHLNKIYLDRICSGHATPLPASWVLGKALNDALAEPDWFFETVWDYGQYDLRDLTRQDIYQPHDATQGITTWTKRQDAHSDYACGFEIRTHRLCRRVLTFHRFPEEFDTATPLLHSATAYIYNESPVRTLLVAAQEAGYYWNGSRYDVNYLPPLEMTYHHFAPEKRPYREMLVKNTSGNDQSLPDLTGFGGNFFTADLYGEGITGWVTSNGQEAFYYQTDWDAIDGKLGGGDPVYYKRADNPVRLPLGMLNKNNHHQLMDINGNGRLDYVTNYAGQLGYYEALQNENDADTGQPKGAWGEFTPIPLTPTELSRPQRFWVDVTGNHIVDCVIPMSNGQLRYYKNNGPVGFEPGQEQQNTPLPSSLQSSEEVFFDFINIAGDGKQHLVHLDREKLKYYPNLGYGQFGEAIEIDNFPTFAEGEFKTSRIHFADLDGTGTADLILAKSNGIAIYPNQCGNRLGSEIFIAYPDEQTYDDLHTQLYFTDVFGNGLTCMIFQQMGLEARQWVYDFNGGVKPYLLARYNNNQGAVTTTSYRSSVHFYLEDKQQQIEWFTRAPFPVWSIHEVIVDDEVSQSKLTETYRYRHSYYDGIEKTFRGYGYVEHTDVISSYNDSNLPENSPPSKSCVWYHSGNPRQGDITSLYQQLEYFMAGSQGGNLPANSAKKDLQAQYLPTYNAEFGTETVTDELTRQAHLHLAGAPIRSELYGLNQEAYAQNPDSTSWELYTSSLSNETVLLVQPLMEASQPLPLLNYASFQVLPRENLGYHYERNLHDPMVGYTAAIKFDNYGHVLQSCTLQYPRRQDYQDAHVEVNNEQRTLRAFTTLHKIENFADPASDLGASYGNEQFYLLGVPTRSYAYFIKNSAALGSIGTAITPNNAFDGYQGAIYDYDTIKNFIQFVTIDSAGNSVTFAAANLEVELMHWSSQEYYYVQPNDNVADPAPSAFLSKKNDLSRPGYRGFLLPKGGDGTAESAFDLTALENILVQDDQFFTSSELSSLMSLPDKGHYQRKTLTSTGNANAQSQDFWATRSGSYTYNDAQQFYTLQEYTDPKGSTITTIYDRYNLLTIAQTDALGNTSKVAELTATYADNTPKRAVDYQLMQPFRTLDLNDNASEVVFDALGRVIASSHYGTTMRWNEESNVYEETREGFGELYVSDTANKTYTTTSPANVQAVIEAPMSHLQMAAKHTYYQPFSWMGQVSLDELKAAVLDESQNMALTNWYQAMQMQGFIGEKEAISSRVSDAFKHPQEQYYLSNVATGNLMDTQRGANQSAIDAGSSHQIFEFVPSDEVGYVHILSGTGKYLGYTEGASSGAWIWTVTSTQLESTKWRIEDVGEEVIFRNKLDEGLAIQEISYEDSIGLRVFTYNASDSKQRWKKRSVSFQKLMSDPLDTLSANDSEASSRFYLRNRATGNLMDTQQGVNQSTIDIHHQEQEFELIPSDEEGYFHIVSGSGKFLAYTQGAGSGAWIWHTSSANLHWNGTKWSIEELGDSLIFRNKLDGGLAIQDAHYEDSIGMQVITYNASDTKQQWEKISILPHKRQQTSLDTLSYAQQQEIHDLLLRKAVVERTPVHVLTTAIKDYPDTSYARVNRDQLIALQTNDEVHHQNVDTWLATAYATNPPYLHEEISNNNEQSTYGIFTSAMRTALENSTDVNSFVAQLQTTAITLGNVFTNFGATQQAVYDLYQQALNQRIEQHLQYSDGLGRSLQRKIKAEPGQECFIFANNQVTTNTGNAVPTRWLTQGHVAYNNKGEVVLAYDPYYIDTPAFVESELLKTLGTSPINYYDALGRVTHSITPKGYLMAHEWTAWDNTIWDANDSLLLSPYYEVNQQFLDGTANPQSQHDPMKYFFDYTDDKLAKISNGNDDEKSIATSIKEALQQTLRLAFTPTNTVHDNRGLTLRSRQMGNYIYSTFILKPYTVLDGTGISTSLNYLEKLISLEYLEEKALGDEQNITPTTAQQTKKYPVLAQNEIKKLTDGLDRKFSLFAPSILAVLWAMHQTNDQMSGTQESVTNAFKAKFEQMLGMGAVPWRKEEYWELLDKLTSLGFFMSRASNPSSPRYTFDIAALDYPVIEDSDDNPLLNLVMMLGWAKGEKFETSSYYDVYGRATKIADPRFTAANDFKTNEKVYNLITTYAGALGAAVKSDYADAGPSWALSDVLGRHLWNRDARNIETEVVYDALHRPTAVKQHLRATASWSATTSRIAYGESIADAQKFNFRGQAVQTFTQGGWSATSRGFNILGQSLGNSLRLTKAFIPDFGYAVPKPCVDLSDLVLEPAQVLQNVALSANLAQVLQTDVYENTAVFDATGEIQRLIDVAQNIHLPQFHLSGGVAQMKVNGIDFMDEVVYNARKQKLSVKTKNAAQALVTHCHYTYDPKNYGLVQIYASHSDADVNRVDEHEVIYHKTGDTRQNLVYTFDPAGNVAALPLSVYQGPDKDSMLHAFNHEVAYKYDGLYRLTRADVVAT